ncbi:unnamed protein product [Cochlearia groenlandica]
MTTMMIVDYQNSFIFILLCFFSLICYSLFFKKPKNNNGYDLPPSPPSLPIIGHLHLLLSSQSHKSLQRLSTKYGPILHLRIFNVPILHVVSPSMVYEIFRTHDEKVSYHGVPAVEESLVFGSSGFVVAPYGDYWRYMKKLIVTKLLGPMAQEQSRGIRAAELERFRRDLLEKAMKKETVDIGKEATKLISNSLCRMSMGRSCSEENNEAKIVIELSDRFASLTKKVFFSQMLRKLGISLFKKEIMDASDRFDELLERILVEHEEKLAEDEQGGKDMMDALLVAYRDENAEYKITRKHIKAIFAEFFIGAAGTSSTTIQWTMAEIINNPNVLARVREEIDSVVGKTRLIQETDLPNLPYLQAVIKEGLRLHPFLPLVVRKFQEGCKMGGFYVPQGTNLLVNAYAMMRDPDSWEDPNTYKPERFLNSGQEEERREKTLKYLPFGSGRRACPGSNLAYVIVGTAIGMMVQCFDWEIEGDKVNMEEAKGSFFLDMAHPLKCIPVTRTLHV